MSETLEMLGNNLTSASNHLITMGNMLNQSISEKEWNDWVKGRDMSFLSE